MVVDGHVLPAIAGLAERGKVHSPATPAFIDERPLAGRPGAVSDCHITGLPEPTRPVQARPLVLVKEDDEPSRPGVGSLFGLSRAVTLECGRFTALRDQADGVIEGSSVPRFAADTEAVRSEAPTYEEEQLGTPATELSDCYDQLARATVRGKLIVI